MVSNWTETKAELRREVILQQMDKGKSGIKTIGDTGLTELGQRTADVVGSVSRTGEVLRLRLLANPMDHLNKSPQDFARRCRELYRANGAQFEFSVLLLVADPLHFDARKSMRVEHAPTQAQQYFGKARPIRITDSGRELYTLQVQVVGAKVSDLLRDDLSGHSLAAAVSSRTLIQSKTSSELAAACSGEQITSMSDLKHLATVLAVADELSSGQNRAVLQTIAVAKGSNPSTIAELAHTHNLPDSVATTVGQKLIRKSTTLNPLQESAAGQDQFVVHPALKDHVVIIPLWDELDIQAPSKVTEDVVTDAILASMALGVMTTFSTEGVAQLTSEVILQSNKGNAVPLTKMKQIQRA